MSRAAADWDWRRRWGGSFILHPAVLQLFEDAHGIKTQYRGYFRHGQCVLAPLAPGARISQATGMRSASLGLALGSTSDIRSFIYRSRRATDARYFIGPRFCWIASGNSLRARFSRQRVDVDSEAHSRPTAEREKEIPEGGM